MKSWKLFEKEVAKFFGGMRRVCISYSEVGSDIIHPTLSIECKYGILGKTIPKYLCVDMPTFLNGYCVYPSSMCNIWEILQLQASAVAQYSTKEYKHKFLIKAFNQAKSYDSTKQPIVCVKAKGMQGFIIVSEFPKVDYSSKSSIA